MQVERERVAIPEYSGELVSNRWIMCPGVGDNTGKPVLIPHTATRSPDLVVKAVVRFRIGPPPIS